jgi:carnosine synthase
MAEAGLPSPRNFLIQHAFQLDAAAKSVGFPAVIKPIYGAASIGVIRVDDEEALAASYARVVREMASARVVSGALQQGDEEAAGAADKEGSAASSWIRTIVMMEEYLDGSEVDVDLVLQDGKVLYSAIADNWPTVEPYFNETGSNAPSVLPLHQQQEMISLSVESVLCLGFHMGVFHVECKYTSRGPRLIEVNCRMGGGPVRYINLMVWGVDLVVEQLMCSVGVPHAVSVSPKPLLALAEFTVNAMKTGILRDTMFLRSFENRKDVMYARALVKSGAKVVCAADGLPTWVCELMVTRPTVQEAIDAIKAMESDIQQTMVIDSITPRVKLNSREYSVVEVNDSKQQPQKSLRGAVIVFITTGLSSKRFIFEKAKALGVRSVVIDTSDSWIKALAKEGLIERFVSLDMSSTEKVFERCLDAINTVRRDLDQVDGVVTFSEIVMPLVTRLCSALGLPANSPASVDLARNKYATRQAMVKAGLPSPRHMLIENPFQLEAAARAVGFPAVLKPISGAASIGVVRVDSIDALQASYSRVIRELGSARVVYGALQQGDEGVLGNAASWMCTMVMLEEYLDGPEVDADFVFSNGQPVFKAIADNWPTMEPYFLETGSNSPSILPTVQQKEILDLAHRSITCIGLQSGVFHVECKYTSTGPRLIEINCRMGGGPIHRINSEVWGVDLVEEQLNATIGIVSQPKAEIKPLKCVAEFSVNAMKTGILRDLNFLNICTNRKDVLYARALAAPGSRVVSVADGLPTWVCELMVSRPTVQEAIECVKAIVYDIQVATAIDRITPRVKLNIKEQKSRL